MVQNRTLNQTYCSQDPICRVPCFESQGKYYNRPYCHLVCLRGTLKGLCYKVLQFYYPGVRDANKTLTDCVLHSAQKHDTAFHCMQTLTDSVSSL